MSEKIYSYLNSENFFKFWACNAFGKESKELKTGARHMARFAAIVFGIFTLGIGTGICRLCLYDRKIIDLSHVKKLEVQKIEKVFNGSSTFKKFGTIYNLRDNSYASKEEYYNIIKGTKTDLCDFILKNEDEFLEISLYDYFFTRKVCDLVNAEEKWEKIEKYIVDCFDFSLLFKHCDSNKIAHFILHAEKGFKKEIIEIISFLDFPQFREKYNCIKKIALEEEAPNPFFILFGETEKSMENLYNQGKNYVIVSEVLAELRTDKLQTITNMIRPITASWQGSLWLLLALHCEIDDIPLLINHRFNFDNEVNNMRYHLFDTLIKSDNIEKWEASLIHVWDNINIFTLNQPQVLLDDSGNVIKEEDPITLKIIKSLTTEEKFQKAFQSLYKSNSVHKYQLLFQCINFLNPSIKLPPIPKRIEIVKNIIWPDIIQWGESDDLEWFKAPVDVGGVMEAQKLFSENRRALQDLLGRMKTQSSCKSECDISKDGILKTIKEIKIIKGKLGFRIIPNIEALETLIDSKEYPSEDLKQLKEMLEMAVFDAVMTENELRLEF